MKLLPDDVISVIFSFLPGPFIIKTCSFVCKQWHRASTDLDSLQPILSHYWPTVAPALDRSQRTEAFEQLKRLESGWRSGDSEHTILLQAHAGRVSHMDVFEGRHVHGGAFPILCSGASDGRLLIWDTSRSRVLRTFQFEGAHCVGVWVFTEPVPQVVAVFSAGYVIAVLPQVGDTLAQAQSLPFARVDFEEEVDAAQASRSCNRFVTSGPSGISVYDIDGIAEVTPWVSVVNGGTILPGTLTLSAAGDRVCYQSTLYVIKTQMIAENEIKTSIDGDAFTSVRLRCHVSAAVGIFAEREFQLLYDEQRVPCETVGYPEGLELLSHINVATPFATAIGDRLGRVITLRFDDRGTAVFREMTVSHSNRISALDLDDRRVISAASDGVRVFQQCTGEELCYFQDHMSQVTCALIRPSLCATGSADYTISLRLFTSPPKATWDPVTPLNKIVSPAAEETRPCVVLVAGGAFSPPHKAHVSILNLARAALEERGFVCVGGYMSPASDHYNKLTLLPAQHRVAMCELILADSPWIMVLDVLSVDKWEATALTFAPSNDGVSAHLSYTLSEALGRPVQTVFVCGEDTLPSLDLRGLSRHASPCPYLVVCVRRPDHVKHPQTSVDERVLVIDWPEGYGISSTVVRKSLNELDTAAAVELCGSAVVEYMSYHNLQRSK